MVAPAPLVILHPVDEPEVAGGALSVAGQRVGRGQLRHRVPVDVGGVDIGVALDDLPADPFIPHGHIGQLAVQPGHHVDGPSSLGQGAGDIERGLVIAAGQIAGADTVDGADAGGQVGHPQGGHRPVHPAVDFHLAHRPACVHPGDQYLDARVFVYIQQAAAAGAIGGHAAPGQQPLGARQAGAGHGLHRGQGLFHVRTRPGQVDIVQGVHPQLIGARADLPVDGHLLAALPVDLGIVDGVDGAALSLHHAGGHVLLPDLGENVYLDGLLNAGHPEKGDRALPPAIPVQVLKLDVGGVVPRYDGHVLHPDGKFRLQPGARRPDGRVELFIARRLLRLAVQIVWRAEQAAAEQRRHNQRHSQKGPPSAHGLRPPSGIKSTTYGWYLSSYHNS